MFARALSCWVFTRDYALITSAWLPKLAHFKTQAPAQLSGKFSKLSTSSYLCVAAFPVNRVLRSAAVGVEVKVKLCNAVLATAERTPGHHGLFLTCLGQVSLNGVAVVLVGWYLDHGIAYCTVDFDFQGRVVPLHGTTCFNVDRWLPTAGTERIGPVPAGGLCMNRQKVVERFWNIIENVSSTSSSSYMYFQQVLLIAASR